MNNSGFAHLLLGVVVFSIAVLLILTSLPLKTTYPSPVRPQVAGVYKLALNSDPSSFKDPSQAGNPKSSKSVPDTGGLDDLSDLTLEFQELDKELEKINFAEEETLNELVNNLETAGVDRIELKTDQDKLNLNVETSSSSAQNTSARKINKKALGKVKIKLFGNTGEKEVNIKSENDTFKLESGGVELETRLQITIDGASDQLEIGTSAGENPLRVLPEDAVSLLKNKKVLNSVEKLELIENKNQNSLDKLTIKAKGRKEGKVFGLIPVSGQVESEVGALSGEILNTTQPVWLKFLDPVIK